MKRKEEVKGRIGKKTRRKRTICLAVSFAFACLTSLVKYVLASAIPWITSFCSSSFRLTNRILTSLLRLSTQSGGNEVTSSPKLSL